MFHLGEALGLIPLKAKIYIMGFGSLARIVTRDSISIELLVMVFLRLLEETTGSTP